ncbi:MAG: DUF3048 domain-containing protein [Patescibacteria group bacterium]|jgi:uncharacterized protein (UPF0333 family)
MDDIYLDSRNVGDVEPPKKKKGILTRIRVFFKNPKKRLIFIIVTGIVLIAAAVTGYYFYMKNTSKGTDGTNPINKDFQVENPTYQAVLDGIMVANQEAASLHPLGIIIENHTDARPQAGLTSASIVYEAIAEGGITRFLALFGENEVDKAGPVRSARTYFVDWAHGYNAFLAHVGGNMDALDKIKAEHILDLDQFAYSKPYWREKGLRVSSEHTMFTSTEGLRAQANSNKYTTDNNFKVFNFKDDPKPDSAEFTALPASQTISINYGNANYNAAFSYDKATNSYLRSQAGKPHTDRVTGKQINPKNVIIMTVNRKSTVTRINEQGYIMDVIGEGKAQIFLDGKEIDGKWKKTSASEREIFYDSEGKEVTFNRGQFWISIISPELSVSVQ